MIIELSFNLNYEAVIYPNEKGWEKIVSNLMSAYKFDKKKATEWAEKRRTKDDGYKEQLWEIMSLHHDMFYNGTSYFKTTNILLLKET